MTLLSEAVLANCELTWLFGRCVGKDMAALMGAFDQVVRVQGDSRAASIAKVQEMAAEGRLLARDAVG